MYRKSLVALASASTLALLAACGDSSTTAPTAVSASGIQPNAAISVGGLPSSTPVSAAGIVPKLYAGNISGDGNAVCTELGYAGGFKIDPPKAGTSNGVTISFTNGGRSLSWEAEAGVQVKAIVMKGGENTNIYQYPYPTTASDYSRLIGGTDYEFYKDAGLGSPGVTVGGGPQISHFVVCLDDSPPPPEPDELTAEITITPNGTNAVGDKHVFTITADAFGGTPAYDFAIATEVNPAPGTMTSTCGTPTMVDANTRSCTLEINSTTPGVFVANASVSVTDNGSPVQLASASTKTEEGGDGPATKYYVAARIKLDPLTDKNGIGEEHKITATVEQHDGTSWSAAPNGTTVTYTIGVTSGTSDVTDVTAGSCAISSGTCEIKFNKPTPGVLSINASSTFNITVAGNMASVTASTADASNIALSGTGPAEKEYVDGSLIWYKHNHLGAPLAGATFSVQRVEDRFGVAVSDAAIIVTDNSAPDADPAAGVLQLIDLALGKWVITETIAPTDFELDATPKSVVLSTTTPNYTFTVAFINRPTFDGCTPGFWQGGKGTRVWTDWTTTSGFAKPFTQGTLFPQKDQIRSIPGVGDMLGINIKTTEKKGATMLGVVGTGGTEDWARKAGRSFIAAMLNATYFTGEHAYKKTPQEILTQWNAAVTSFHATGSTALLQAFHIEYDAYNNYGCPL